MKIELPISIVRMKGSYYVRKDEDGSIISGPHESKEEARESVERSALKVVRAGKGKGE